RFLDDTGGAGAHDLAELDRRDIGLALVHPAAHGRIERDVFDLDAELARTRLRHGRVLDREISPLHHAFRPAGELDHAVAHLTPHLDFALRSLRFPGAITRLRDPGVKGGVSRPLLRRPGSAELIARLRQAGAGPARRIAGGGPGL